MKRFRDAIAGLPGKAQEPPDLKAFPMVEKLFRDLPMQASAPELKGAPQADSKPFVFLEGHGHV